MRRFVLPAALLALASCASTPAPRAVTISFAGRVGDAPFACGMTYPNVGTTNTTLTALDFRFYVHDVALITDAGTAVPVTLTEDGTWQTHGVALLDFEDGHGCEEGNAPTNLVVRGTVPADGARYVGVRFRLGVPQAMNYLDAANQPSPLNLTSMFWGWSNGYKFLRVDGRTTGQPSGFRFHLGSTGCTGDPTMGMRTCTESNSPEVTLMGFDVDHDTVVADQAGMFVGSDLDHSVSGIGGCMSEPDNADCTPMFAAIGLGPMGPSAQTAFRVVHGAP